MQLKFEQGRLKFDTRDDGSIKGLVGGYTDWMRFYRVSSGDGAHTQGSIHENLGWFQLPAWWYSLKRNADGLPDAKTGEKTGISAAYSITAIPAFITLPDGKTFLKEAQPVLE